MTNDDMQMAWIKFDILTSDPFRVYYQDSRKYAFHYDYATHRLALFKGMTPAQFDAVSLWRTNQQVVLGSVIYPLGKSHSTMRQMIFPEYGVQFVGMEAYSPDEIARWFTLVKATVFASNNITAFYVPTFEQSEVARTNAAAFSALGIPVTTIERWIWMNDVYASGWALGQLKYFPSLEVDAAFADGRLRPEDILLTDGVSAHTPLVAGILTLTPATPNSHTALLSQSFGIPFAYLSEAGEQARVRQLVGRKVLFRASFDRGIMGFTPQTSLISIFETQVMDAAFEAQLINLKRQPLHFPPKQPYGAISAVIDNLTPEDTQFFGGKTANYAILSNLFMPTIAFSFDLWDAFMDQVLPGGKSLREEIAARLAPFTNYPPDLAALKTALAAIRDLITKKAFFTPEQQEAVTNVLAIFTPSRKIRFRSSTNVEDLEQFTGAGLYDSYSGCLLDDLDENTVGPCQCDAREPNERGVFRAIQKVYASFYNDNAYLARLAHRVDEAKVGMGLLVHYSYPDEDELANGVATLRCESPADQWGFVKFTGELVTQLGAESVTNPSGKAIPEIMEILPYQQWDWTPRQFSSLVPLGAFVLEYNDYLGLEWQFNLITRRFHELYPEQYVFNLDFEYKKVDIPEGRGMVIKQVRQLPDPGAINQENCFLVDDPSTLRITQQDYLGVGSDIYTFGNVFEYHRLKSLWTLHTPNVQLTSSNLAQGFYTEAICQYVEDGVVKILSGPVSSWPNAAYTYSPDGITNTWTTGTGPNQRTWRLATVLPADFSGPQAPVFTHVDFPKMLIVTSLTTRDDGSITTNTDKVGLELLPQASEGALQQRTISKTNGPAIITSFYWPKESFPAGYTAPLLRFVETRIMGLTTTPIVLTNYFSQTYSPAHHNFADYFIFEPRLEPSLSFNILAELKAANIQFIYAVWDAYYNKVGALQAMGFDQKLRDL